MKYYLLIIVSHFIIFYEQFLFLREQWIYNKYYRFAPFYIVFLLLFLFIKIYKSNNKVFVEKHSVPLSTLYFCSYLFACSYLGIIVSLELKFNYLFFISFILLLIAYSFFFVQKEYCKLFTRFYSFFILTIPLPFLTVENFYKAIDLNEFVKLEEQLKIVRIIIVFMFIFILFFFVVLLTKRKLYNKRLRYKKKYKEFYLDILNNYLYDNISLEDASLKLQKIEYTIFLISVDTILDVVKGEFEEKIILLCREKGLYDFLIEESNSKKWWKKVKSIYHLGRLKYKEGLNNGFYENMLNNKNDDVRAVTVVALTLINNINAINYIVNSLFDSKEIVSEKAKEGLIKYGKKSYASIFKNLEKESDTDKIVIFLDLFSKIRDYNFITVIDDYLGHSNRKIVIESVKIASSLEYPINKKLLLFFLESDDINLLMTVLENIHNISDVSIIEYIRDFLYHENWNIRYFTAAGLYKLGKEGKNALQEFILYSNDKFAADMANMVWDELTQI